jgi:hypothetical protein
MRADSDFPDLDSVIIKERNDRWMPEIEKVVNKQSAFIAVGARHLSGKNGLINRLRKERYIVKPVYI